MNRNDLRGRIKRLHNSKPMKPAKETDSWNQHFRPSSVSIVIVAYNDARGLSDCLESIKRYEPATQSSEIVVVDNSSTTDVREMVSILHSDVKYVSNPNNGYGAGNNRGSTLANGDILFFLNPDACLTEPLFDDVAKLFSSRPSLGALGVRITSPAGAFQQSFFWVDAGGVCKSLLQKILTRAGIYLPRVMCTSGAALFVRRAAFEEAGAFDTNMFLYCEESDLWRRMTARGWRWAYASNLHVSHVGGGSIPDVRFAASQRFLSLRYYCAKYNLNYYARLQKEMRYFKLVSRIKQALCVMNPSKADGATKIVCVYQEALAAASTADGRARCR